ncbi:MAG: hypothetical protein WCW77_03485 [Patescibacteria group bacterium]|jgi:hypothetical protein
MKKRPEDVKEAIIVRFCPTTPTGKRALEIHKRLEAIKSSFRWRLKLAFGGVFVILLPAILANLESLGDTEKIMNDRRLYMYLFTFEIAVLVAFNICSWFFKTRKQMLNEAEKLSKIGGGEVVEHEIINFLIEQDSRLIRPVFFFLSYMYRRKNGKSNRGRKAEIVQAIKEIMGGRGETMIEAYNHLFSAEGRLLRPNKIAWNVSPILIIASPYISYLAYWYFLNHGALLGSATLLIMIALVCAIARWMNVFNITLFYEEINLVKEMLEKGKVTRKDLARLGEIDPDIKPLVWMHVITNITPGNEG